MLKKHTFKEVTGREKLESLLVICLYSCNCMVPLNTTVPAQEKFKNSSDNAERDQIRRRSSRLSSSISHEILNTDLVTTSTEIQSWKDTVSNQSESEKGKCLCSVLWIFVMRWSCSCCKVYIFSCLTCRLHVCH